MKAIDKALLDLLLRLDLSRIVSMTNREEAREAFLVQHAESGRKDPVFEYDRSAQIDAEFTPRLPLEEAEEPDTILDLYRQKERELFAYARLLGSVGTNEFTRWAVDLFGAPTRKQALEAEEALVSLKDNTFQAVGEVESSIIIEK